MTDRPTPPPLPESLSAAPQQTPAGEAGGDVEPKQASLEEKLRNSVTLALAFGEETYRPTEWLLRALTWDPSLGKDLEAWATARGVPPDAEDGSVIREKLALKVMQRRRRGSELNMMYSLGMLLHVLRGPEVTFPAGTLFEQREVTLGKGGNPPKTDRITDSSSGWQSQLGRVKEGGLLHVANIHRSSLLPPSQANEYLNKLPADKLTLQAVREMAGPDQFNIGQDAITQAMDHQNVRPAYWAHPSHVAALPEADHVQDFFSFSGVATFREYCQFLWDVAKTVWAIRERRAEPEELDNFRAVARKNPDEQLTAEQKGAIYAAMQDFAVYAKGAGLASHHPYYAAGTLNVPGQQNLLDIAYYWVTHVTDAGDSEEDSRALARFLDVCYDFFQWAGAAGLFAFHKVGTVEEVGVVSDPTFDPNVYDVLADLKEIAAAEGLSVSQALQKDNPLVANPRIHATTPWSNLTGPTSAKVSRSDTVRVVQLNILRRRMMTLFALLGAGNWRDVAEQGVAALVRHVLAEQQGDLTRSSTSNE